MGLFSKSEKPGPEMKVARHECDRDGHRFSPRYDEHPNPEPMTIEGPEPPTTETLRAAYYYRVYIWDVCTYCGETREPECSNPLKMRYNT